MRGVSPKGRIANRSDTTFVVRHAQFSYRILRIDFHKLACAEKHKTRREENMPKIMTLLLSGCLLVSSGHRVAAQEAGGRRAGVVALPLGLSHNATLAPSHIDAADCAANVIVVAVAAGFIAGGISYAMEETGSGFFNSHSSAKAFSLGALAGAYMALVGRPACREAATSWLSRK